MSAESHRLVERLGTRAAMADGEPLAARLATIFAEAEAKLPARPVSRIAFVDRIADGLLSLADPLDAGTLDKIFPADLYLACALGAHDAHAIALAESELMPAIRQSVGKVDASAAFVDEVAQRCRERLLVQRGEAAPAIEQYRGTGPLARWVRIIATRIALDLKRAGSKIADDEDALAQLPAPEDPELEVIWRTCAVEYKAALYSAFAALTARERSLLRQRYLDGLDIDALGRVFRVHPSTAFRWLQQVERQLASVTRTALMSKLAISESQVHSMERMVANQLELSLPRLLRGGKKS